MVGPLGGARASTRTSILQRSVALSFVLAAALSGCKRESPAGRACQKADECGAGFDCYHDACVHVCATPDECPTGTSCTRYRCLPSGAAAPDAADSTGAPGARGAAASAPPGPPVDPSIPPPPDAIAAELRAIRRELEIVRREQQRLTELVEGKGGAAPRSPNAPLPSAPDVTVPTPPPSTPQKRSGIR